jgi:hypothetical protein
MDDFLFDQVIGDMEDSYYDGPGECNRGGYDCGDTYAPCVFGYPFHETEKAYLLAILDCFESNYQDATPSNIVTKWFPKSLMYCSGYKIFQKYRGRNLPCLANCFRNGFEWCDESKLPNWFKLFHALKIHPEKFKDVSDPSYYCELTLNCHINGINAKKSTIEVTDLDNIMKISKIMNSESNEIKEV